MKRSVFAVLTSLALGSSVSFAAPSECIGQGTENETCLVLPEDYGKAAKAASNSKSVSMISIAETSGAADPMDLEVELEGGELLADAEEVEGFEDLGGVVALHEAIEVQNRIHDLEIFLKSGPAANGPLSVIATGKK